ncbi:MAG: RsmB/NOP family class I SAM-dependent RNA methyltransferase, partial [Lachnospiraceae bacterium]|nr:RsmB/NOP family class I SAM-dependent RNA methyltransferase [Lachnospiraceae bacterium]
MYLPEAFQKKMKAILGEEYDDFLAGFEKPRHYGLRVNTAKITVEEFKELVPFHLTQIPWVENGFYYEEEDAPTRHPYYYAGLYYIQEPSAMTPASILPVMQGEHVLDLCAAPGGKATALGAKLAGEGLLVANDISASRAKALLKNLEIFGIRNSFVTNAYPAKLAEQFAGAFDKILVDAPCSGEGMFRKDLANARVWSLEKVKEC